MDKYNAMTYLATRTSYPPNNTAQDYLLTREQMSTHNSKIHGIQADRGHFILLQHALGRNR